MEQLLVPAPRAIAVAMLGTLCVILAACSGGASNLTPTATTTPQSGAFALLPAFTELAAEPSRFSFAILAPDNSLVEDAQVSVRFRRTAEEQAQFTQAQAATFRSVETTTPHIHEDGQTHLHIDTSGVYVVDAAVEFDASGPWEAHLQVSPADGSEPFPITYPFTVFPQPSTPRLGELAPASRNRTARDVQDLAELSTRIPPIAEMHQVSVAEALDRGRPFVVAFSTPAFCQSRLCGPILDVVATLLPTYGDEVDFIHIEPYDLELLRTQGQFQLSPAALEWGLLSEPFVFVVDAQGRLAAKFEGIFAPEELVLVLQPLL